MGLATPSHVTLYCSCPSLSTLDSDRVMLGAGFPSPHSRNGQPLLPVSTTPRVFPDTPIRRLPADATRWSVGLGSSPSQGSQRAPTPTTRGGAGESRRGGRAPLLLLLPPPANQARTHAHTPQPTASSRHHRPRPPPSLPHKMQPQQRQQQQARHAKTDSEVTSSMAPSSPPRAAYYVQSPSHDDGENKTAASSFHSSPAASPPRSLGRASRDSSSSRFSASAKSRAAGAAGAGGGAVPTAGGGGGGRRAWAKEAAIEEEGLLGMDDDGDDDGYGGGGGGWSGIPRRVRYGILFVGAFFGLFFFFALILWGASRNQRPVVTLQTVTFHRFVVQAGTDASLVPTEMASLNATVKLTFRNTGTFFGVHVSAEPVTLFYTQLQLASGDLHTDVDPSKARGTRGQIHRPMHSSAPPLQLPASTSIASCRPVLLTRIKYFYQARKSQRSLTVAVVGDKVPLYGGGSSLSSTPTTLPPPKKKMPSVVVPPPPVPLELTVRVRLVKPKFYSEARCSVTMDQTKLGKPVSLKKRCTYSH
ncbi:hypothetical protein HU200_009346 [Digitaria exilis]|uniref:Late embryogenesis abundant protein LEA-2 subgroup domain-containing protein n=1 Tax=Digitaria exilis TaxID=1010633 RepID=A0A835KSR1_9POAL|nr:hypothetical protein HU200_009346 [Digitaria exilis]